MGFAVFAGFLCGIIGFFLGLLDEHHWVKYYQAEIARYQKMWLEGVDQRNKLCKRIVQLEKGERSKKAKRVSKKRK